MSSIHRLRCMLDRRLVTWYNTQSLLDRYQRMRGDPRRNTLRESHQQRPCVIEKKIPSLGHTHSLPDVQGVLRLDADTTNWEPLISKNLSHTCSLVFCHAPTLTHQLTQAPASQIHQPMVISVSPREPSLASGSFVIRMFCWGWPRTLILRVNFQICYSPSARGKLALPLENSVP